MKKCFIFVLVLMMVLSMAACKSSETQSDENELLSPEDLGLQKTKNQYTRDFNPTTNQTVSFDGIEFQIPASWSIVEKETEEIYIQGKEESQLGWMCIEIIADNVSESDLAEKSLQETIINAYSQLFKEAFDEFEVTTANYNSKTQLFFGNFEGTINKISASFGICSFVENGKLYNYVVPCADGDAYCYDLDVQEVVNSVSSAAGSTAAPVFEVVTYDSIVAGKHTNETVSIEAIVSSYVHEEITDSYSFDLWYWSEKENRYIQHEYWLIFEEHHEKEAIAPLKVLKDGDKIRVTTQVYGDNSFGSSGYIGMEILHGGILSDYGIETPSTPSGDTPSSDKPNTSSADTSQIDVSFVTDYLDGDRLHVIVYIENHSEEIFKGDVYVTFYSRDGKDRLGSDTILVDKLLPGQMSWAKTHVNKYLGTPKMTTDFLNVRFSPVEEVTADIDADATEKTKRSYYLNFDGVSWYKDITDIIVYTDGTCMVSVKDTTKNDGQFYASVIWSCGNSYGVKSVKVVNPSGTLLALYRN